MSEQMVFERLMETIQQRAESRPKGSYTTKLLDGGAAKIGEKILEEAGEVVEASTEEGDAGKDHFTYEVGDLLYHLFVMMAWRGVSLDDVAQELARREGMGGLVEKQQRTQKKSST